ncbi:MAG: tetratricopeptide repeat protein [Thermodesulfovibrionales bacterium]
MSLFDKIKNKLTSDIAEDESVILKRMDILFEESMAKGEAFEKLGRHDEAGRKYQETASRLSEMVRNSPRNYMYALKAGELFMKLGYTKDKIFFNAAEAWYQLVINNFRDDRDADLTLAYWRLGLIEERLKNNQKTAVAYYDLAIKTPKGKKITDYQKKYDLSAVYLSLAYMYKTSNVGLSKQYARKRLEVMPDCPQAKDILNDFNSEAPNFDGGANSEDSGTIFLNDSLADKKFVLVGAKRTINISGGMLSVLLITAKQSDWNGGRKLFDASGQMLQISDRPIALDRDDALNLGTILRKQMKSDNNRSPELLMIKDVLNFFTEGGFEIRTL